MRMTDIQYSTLYGLPCGVPYKVRNNPHYNRGKDAREFLEYVLNELPKIPIHHCRKVSMKPCLTQDFKTLSEVHKAYMHFYSQHHTLPLKLTVFVDIFHQKNLSVFKPKKDRYNYFALDMKLDMCQKKSGFIM